MIRYVLMACLLISSTGMAQVDQYKPTEKDTLITCTITSRSRVSGPFADTHAADFEKLVAAVFEASPFPAYEVKLFRANDPEMIRVGRHLYDELEYRTFMTYNLDSAMNFNLKAKTRYGLMSVLAHEAGHHALNHFMPWPNPNIATQELQADYFAGWLLAKLNVPKEDITKGIVAINREGAGSAGYPPVKDRLNATLLGYAVSTASGAAPLALLTEDAAPAEDWLKKWSRKSGPSGRHYPLTETTFSQAVELDERGQLLYSTNNATYVIARAMPSKDKRYAYCLFDNQFNTWWIERDGTVRTADGEKTLAHVNLDVLRR